MGDNLIVDAHVHVTPDGRWFQTRHDASLSNLITEMNRSDIERAVVLPISPMISNEFISQICTKHPDRLFGFASINPSIPRASDKLENDVKKYNLIGLKLHQNIQKFDFNNESFRSVIQAASNLEIPLIIDTWYTSNDENLLFFKTIDDIVESIPELVVILPHLGGKAPGEVSRFQDYDNVYFDISFVFSRFGREFSERTIENRILEIGARKLIYGSDYPEISPSNYLKYSINILERLQFSSLEKDLVFSKNILKIFNI
ncbi:hypothetical protein ES703_125778 [subsurface metagenome]